MHQTFQPNRLQLQFFNEVRQSQPSRYASQTPQEVNRDVYDLLTGMRQQLDVLVAIAEAGLNAAGGGQRVVIDAVSAALSQHFGTTRPWFAAWACLRQRISLDSLRGVDYWRNLDALATLTQGL